MKKGVIISLLVLILIISPILAECQYKEVAYSNKSVNNLYIEGIKQENILEVKNLRRVANFGSGTDFFEVHNNLEIIVSVNVRFVHQGRSVIDRRDILPHNFASFGVEYFYERGGLDYNSITFEYLTNNYSEARWEKEEYLICKQCFGVECLNDGSSCTGDYQCGSGLCSHGICSNEDRYGQELMDLRNNISIINQRISILESWKTSIITSISNIWASISGNSTKCEMVNNRSLQLEKEVMTLKQKVSILENEPSNEIPNYFKYLNLNDKKNILCGYAIDKHLPRIDDLGLNCTITYKPSYRGERASCKCK